MSEADRGYVNGQLYNSLDQYRKWKNPYTYASEELDILQRSNISPSFTMAQSVVTARTPQNPLIINQPGRAFRIKGLTLSTLYDPVANTGIETVASSVLVGCYILNTNGNSTSFDPQEMLLIKHGGGFRGDFLNLALFWPAQANNAFRIEVYRYDGIAWQSGDAAT